MKEFLAIAISLWWLEAFCFTSGPRSGDDKRPEVDLVNDRNPGRDTQATYVPGTDSLSTENIVLSRYRYCIRMTNTAQETSKMEISERISNAA
jgi:hypothetical protein